MHNLAVYRHFSPARVGVLARNTLTQLVRMRAFYFLLIFSVIVLVSALLIQNFTFDPARQLKIMKDMSFFAMSMFGTIFAIVATANLIPKDVEDRTLYTILAKPVPRFEYLLGKYLGAMLVIVLSMAVMMLMLCVVLYLRQQALLTEQQALLDAGAPHAEEIVVVIDELKADGPSASLITAAAAICLQAMVLGAVTLFVSTFASSGLFTVVVAFMLFFVGYIEPVVVDYWRGSMESLGSVANACIHVVELIFPNFQSFNLVDDVVSGKTLPLSLFFKILGMGLSYVVVYLLAAYFIFADKEL